MGSWSAPRTARPRVPNVAPMDAYREHDSREALVLAAQRDDPGARDELVEAFLPLVGSVARTYRHVRAVDRAELMQDGVVGLLRALERYDPSLGTPFWAYAKLVGAPGDAEARRGAVRAGRPLRPRAPPARARA